MSYKIDTIANFRKEAKKLTKKYLSLKNELKELGSQLAENPTLGTSLGNNCYKIRLAITSKGKANPVVQGSSLISMLPMKRYSCSPFTTNPTRTISPTKNY